MINQNNENYCKTPLINKHSENMLHGKYVYFLVLQFTLHTLQLADIRPTKVEQSTDILCHYWWLVQQATLYCIKK